MTTPTAAEIEAIRARDAIAHHPDRVADSGKIHVFGDYLDLATDGIRDRHALLTALDAANDKLRDLLDDQIALSNPRPVLLEPEPDSLRRDLDRRDAQRGAEEPCLGLDRRAIRIEADE